MDTPFPASDPQPQFPDWARPRESARRARETSRRLRSLLASPSLARPAEPRPPSGPLSFLRPFSFYFHLSTSVAVVPFLSFLTHFSLFDRPPLPKLSLPRPSPPHCLASPHCPMPGSLCHANLSLIVPSPRLRVLAPAPRCPHISSPRLIPPSPLVWVPSHHPSAIKMLRGKVAWRSRHSSALFRRTQASESPRTPSSETPPSSFTHTCAVPEYSHPCAPLARISILDLGVASAP